MEIAEIKVFYSSNKLEKIKISCSEDSYEVFKSHWNNDIIEFQEEVKILLLNRANMVLGIFNLSKGGSTSTVVDVKIILSIALKANASSIIIAHNHPSGNLVPSGSDKDITSKLKNACKVVDLDLLDHLIISKAGYFSFADQGILP